MKKDKHSESLDEKICDLVEGSGYEYVGMEITREHERKVLRIYIDSLGGIMLKDCETVSHVINRHMGQDKNVEPEGRYYLEVSSPGIERPLFKVNDYEKFVGNKASIRTRKPFAGKKKFKAMILGTRGSEVKFKADQEKVFFVDIDDIVKANLIWDGFKDKKTSK